VGIKVDKLIGVVLVLIGISMVLIAADLVFIAEVDWSARAIADVSLLASIGIAAVVFGCKRFLAHRG
jgi:hypothetical protein